MDKLSREQTNALSAISWRSFDIEDLKRPIAADRPRSDRWRQARREHVRQLESARRAFLRPLVDTREVIRGLRLRTDPASRGFLDEFSRTGLPPLSVLVSKHRRVPLPHVTLALAISAAAAAEVADDLADGDPEREAYLDYVEIVEDAFLAASRGDGPSSYHRL